MKLQVFLTFLANMYSLSVSQLFFSNCEKAWSTLLKVLKPQRGAATLWSIDSFTKHTKKGWAGIHHPWKTNCGAVHLMPGEKKKQFLRVTEIFCRWWTKKFVLSKNKLFICIFFYVWGNEFLSNIGAVDAIYHCVRAFTAKKVEHVDGDVDPIRDLETISSKK